MTLTLNITDDLKPDELGELVELSKQEEKPVGVIILEAARDRARRRREQLALRQTATPETPAAA